MNLTQLAISCSGGRDTMTPASLTLGGVENIFLYVLRALCVMLEDVLKILFSFMATRETLLSHA